MQTDYLQPSLKIGRRRRQVGAFWAASSAALFILDRLLKTLALKNFFGRPVDLFPGAIFSLYQNRFLAFGLPVPNWFLAPLAALALTAALAWSARRGGARAFWTEPSRLLLLLGAGSNLIDRLFWGGAIDYLIIAGRSAWNLADLMVIAALTLLLFPRAPTQK